MKETDKIPALIDLTFGWEEIDDEKITRKILQVTSAMKTVTEEYELGRVGGCFGFDDQGRPV